MKLMDIILILIFNFKSSKEPINDKKDPKNIEIKKMV